MESNPLSNGRGRFQGQRLERRVYSYFKTVTNSVIWITDMITVTPRQLLCQTTDIVTGWINGFHFWDAAGNTLSPHPFLQSTDNNNTNNNTVHLDNVSYP
jgi:hypothetical protein